jgi:ribosomal protein S12 methylthiotransferase accessory factor
MTALQEFSVSPLSLRSLRDGPSASLTESLRRARRLVSDRTGIVANVEFLEQSPEDPAVHQAWSSVGNAIPVLGRNALNRGVATSADPQRAIMKALGESIERYCSAYYGDSALRMATFDELRQDGQEAINPSRLALFSSSQYADPAFRFRPLSTDTTLRWVLGHSLGNDQPTWLPAAVVYVPYTYDGHHGETPFQDSISTGQACGPTLASASAKAVLEAIERDAFMIVWQNRLRRPGIDLDRVDDLQVQTLLAALDGVPVDCHAILLTLDIDVPVVLVVLTGHSREHPPQTVIGVGTDLSPTRALTLALEEACLGFCGMSRLAAVNRDFQAASDYHDVDTLDRHGLAHALLPELRASVDFLINPDQLVALSDLPDRSSSSSVANLRLLVNELAGHGLDVITVDLTTPDIDDVGFKVVRAVVPGLQPLDISHARQHRGGLRLYDVPVRLGLRERAAIEAELNPYPHPFP